MIQAKKIDDNPSNRYNFSFTKNARPRMFCTRFVEVSNQALDGWHFSCTPRCIRFRFGFILFLINFCLRGRNYVRVPTRVLSHTSNMDTTASRNKFAYFIFSGWL